MDSELTHPRGKQQYLSSTLLLYNALGLGSYKSTRLSKLLSSLPRLSLRTGRRLNIFLTVRLCSSVYIQSSDPQPSK